MYSYYFSTWHNEQYDTKKFERPFQKILVCVSLFRIGFLGGGGFLAVANADTGGRGKSTSSI